MLNEAIVDIKQDPLGDYENGALNMDDDGMEEGVGSNKELKEVEEGVFEETMQKNRKLLLD
jgi:hypothetical protein